LDANVLECGVGWVEKNIVVGAILYGCPEISYHLKIAIKIFCYIFQIVIKKFVIQYATTF
jgi:hypothetical protein